MPRFKIFFIFFVAFIVCGLCSVPWPGNWDERVPGTAESEAWQTLWVFDHARSGLFGGKEIDMVADVNPPQGTLLHPYVSMIYPLAMAPLTKALGPAIAVNIAVWLGLYLTFLCAYLFFWEVSGDFWPGVLAGFAFACGTYSLSEIGNGAVTTGVPFMVPLAGFFVIRFLDRGGTVYGILAIIMMVLTSQFNITFGYVIWLFAACATIYALFDEGVRAFTRGLVALIASLVLFLPNLIVLERATGEPSVAHSLDLLSPFFFRGQYPNVFPIVPCLAAIAATFIVKNKRDFWWVVGAIFFALSLGSLIMIGGRPTQAPGLGALYQSLPLWPNGPDPYRFIIGTWLAFCALFALGVRHLLERLESKGKDESLATRGIYLVLIVIALFTASGETVATEIHKGYSGLGRRGAILELPIFQEEVKNAKQLYAQVEHKKTVICGPPFVSSPDRNYFSNLPDNHSLKILSKYGSQGGFTPQIKKEDILSYDIAYVVLHRDGMTGHAASMLSKSLAGLFRAPIYTDAQMSVFSTR